MTELSWLYYFLPADAGHPMQVNKINRQLKLAATKGRTYPLGQSDNCYVRLNFFQVAKL